VLEREYGFFGDAMVTECISELLKHELEVGKGGLEAG
jgi:hypothetical protein